MTLILVFSRAKILVQLDCGKAHILMCSDGHFYEREVACWLQKVGHLEHTGFGCVKVKQIVFDDEFSFF